MTDWKPESAGIKQKSKKSVRRTERRFVPTRSRSVVLTVAGVLASGVALGAGTYGYCSDGFTPAASPWLLAVGAVVLLASIAWGELEGTTLRVGDAGVAWDKHGKINRRIAWCNMLSVGIADGSVYFATAEGKLSFRIDANPLAAAWVATEAQRRIPNRWKASKADCDSLVKTSSSDGELVGVEAIQTAGRACRGSGRPITFEQDAVYCPNCGEVYLRSECPPQCLTCETSVPSDVGSAGV